MSQKIAPPALKAMPSPVPKRIAAPTRCSHFSTTKYSATSALLLDRAERERRGGDRDVLQQWSQGLEPERRPEDGRGGGVGRDREELERREPARLPAPHQQ